MAHSILETQLKNAVALDRISRDVGILRDVLAGIIGTADQRSMLIRIVQQNTPTGRWISDAICKDLNTNTAPNQIRAADLRDHYPDIIF